MRSVARARESVADHRINLPRLARGHAVPAPGEDPVQPFDLRLLGEQCIGRVLQQGFDHSGTLPKRCCKESHESGAKQSGMAATEACGQYV